jgi:hypothetical protein
MKRNNFNLSYNRKMSGNMGKLIPIGWQEVIPGDILSMKSTAFIRTAPLAYPVMHPVHVRVGHFFVPNNIMWDDFYDFISGGDDGNDSTAHPTINFSGGISVGSLADKLGIDPDVNYAMNALPFRAYGLIHNHFFRDKDLQTELTVSKGNGNDTTTNTTLQSVCWQKDRFTVARPWEQKGDDVLLPLGSTAPIESDGTQPTYQGQSSSTTGGLQASSGGDLGLSNGGSFTLNEALHPVNTGLRANVSNLSSATINLLRAAWSEQKFKERRALFGNDYPDYVAASFGTIVPDHRVRRPEYLGGSKDTIQFSEVVQTGVDSTDAGVGNLKGYGSGAATGRPFIKHFSEHGIVMSCMWVRPVAVYAQSQKKGWFRTTKEDYFQPEYANIGQQTIYNKEVMGGHTTPEGIHGYGQPYDDYRYNESEIAGKYRTDLDHTHLARKFASDTALNSSFVTCDPSSRVFADQNAEQLEMTINHSIVAKRKIPKMARQILL